MLANAKKILITSQTDEILIVRHPSKRQRGFCHKCSAEVWLLTLDETVTFLPVGTRKVMSLIDEGSVHSIEAASGHLLVCEESLRNLFDAVHQIDMDHE